MFINNVHLDLRTEKYGCDWVFLCEGLGGEKSELFHIFYDLYQSQRRDGMLKKIILCASDLVFSKINFHPPVLTCSRIAYRIWAFSSASGDFPTTVTSS